MTTGNHQNNTSTPQPPPPPTAVESFVLTTCHPIRHVASDRSVSLLGTLKTDHPEELDCGKNGAGMKAVSATSTPLESSHPLGTLQQYLSSHNATTAWSLSVWFTPLDTNSTKLESIVSFGRSATTGLAVDNDEIAGSNGVSDNGACSDNYFQIMQFQSSLLVRFQDSEDAESCRNLFVQEASLVPQALTQVTVTVGPVSSNIHVNGVTVLPDIPFVAAISTWNPQTTLQLFSTHSSSMDVFQGSIAQVSFFDTALTNEQIAIDFQRGVLDAPPLAPLPLTAENDALIVIPQDHHHERARFWLGGSRPSSEFLPLAVELLQLPTHGQVFLDGFQDPLVLPVNSGTMMYLNPGDLGIWFEYQPTSEDFFFSVPRTNAIGESFPLPADALEFRLLAMNSTLSVVGASEPALQEFEIQHVNHKPSWITPKNATVVLMDGLPQVDFGAIHLDDSFDKDMNRVRIDLKAVNGTLTLDPSHSGLVDFNSCTSLRSSDWQCRGNGVDDPFMTFLAVPSSVQLILSGLHYEGDMAGAADYIDLTVFDGADGQCLSSSEHEKDAPASGLGTIHRECFQVTARINIPAIEIPSLFEENDEKGIFRLPNADFRDFGIADVLFWVVVISVVVCCCCCFRHCPNCLARGTGIVPDDYDSGDEETHYSETDDESDIESISSIPQGQADVESGPAEKQASTEDGGDNEKLSLPSGDAEVRDNHGGGEQN